MVIGWMFLRVSLLVDAPVIAFSGCVCECGHTPKVLCITL